MTYLVSFDTVSNGFGDKAFADLAEARDYYAEKKADPRVTRVTLTDERGEEPVVIEEASW